jgi:hypothetical protein
VRIVRSQGRHTTSAGRFTLRPSAERTKDSSDLVGEERKFVV